MKTEKTIKSISIPLDTVRKIENFQEKYDVNSFSNSVVKLCNFALRTEEMKAEIQKPEFAQTWEAMQNKENIFSWVNELPENVKGALKMAIEMDLEGKLKNTTI